MSIFAYAVIGACLACLVWATWDMVRGVKRQRELQRLLSALEVVRAHGVTCHCRACRDAHAAMGMPEDMLVAFFDRDVQEQL